MAVLQPRWGGKPGTKVGVNNSFVALIATESVSIAIPWLLLPLEVGVNRHGLQEIETKVGGGHSFVSGPLFARLLYTFIM